MDYSLPSSVYLASCCTLQLQRMQARWRHVEGPEEVERVTNRWDRTAVVCPFKVVRLDLPSQ